TRQARRRTPWRRPSAAPWRRPRRRSGPAPPRPSCSATAARRQTRRPTDARARSHPGALPACSRPVARPAGSFCVRTVPGRRLNLLSLPMWILVLALALLLFWAVGAYGRLARLRAAVHRAFGALDAHQLRLLALLSELEAASGSGATHARAQAARAVLVAAGAGLAEALAVARARPLDAAALDALAAQ